MFTLYMLIKLINEFMNGFAFICYFLSGIVIRFYIKFYVHKYFNANIVYFIKLFYFFEAKIIIIKMLDHFSCDLTGLGTCFQLLK